MRRSAAALAILTVGTLVAILLWPALVHGGVLAHRDLLIMDRIPAPRSWWWMGPDLGRRLPVFVPLALASDVVGGWLTGRAMLVITLAALGAGTFRLVRRATGTTSSMRVATTTALTASVLVLCSPFITTRLSIGHLTTLWAVAALPFLIDAGLRRPTDVARSGAATMAAVLGFVSGIYSLVVILAVARRRRAAASLGSWALRNSVWLLPGMFLQAQGATTLADPATFRPRFPTGWGVLGLVIGRGYWDPGAEALRGHDVVVAAVGLTLVGCAALGWRRASTDLRRITGWSLAIGYGVPLLSAAPALSTVHGWLARTPLGAPLREPHRLVGLGLVALVVLVSLGVADLCSPGRADGRVRWMALAPVALLGASSWLLVGALPTVHTRLAPLPVPASWVEAQRMVSAEPGGVLALPWSEYVLLEIGKPRVVYNPLADLFGPETLASSDPQLGPPVNESADRRAASGAAAAAALSSHQVPMDLLHRLGIRWIAVLRVEGVSSLDLTTSADLQRTITSASLDLYRVGSTPIAEARRPLPFVVTGSRGRTDVPWTWGWVGGGAHETPEGLLAADGTAVFLPAVGTLATYGAVGAASIRRYRRRRRRPVGVRATVLQPESGG